MKIKRKIDSAGKKSAKLHRKKRKLEDVERPGKKLKTAADGENEDISFADELAQLARDDPALYEFLKHEEQDLFDEANDDLDGMEKEEESTMNEEQGKFVFNIITKNYKELF
jgi:hypothetical protein